MSRSTIIYSVATGVNAGCVVAAPTAITIGCLVFTACLVLGSLFEHG